MTYTLVIADDHAMVRAGIKTLIEGSSLEVVAEAAQGQEAIEAVRQTHPQVVLLDVRMPVLDGLEALSKLREEQPPPNVVMLSSYDYPTYRARAAALGAKGFLNKGASREQLVTALETAAKGESAWATEDLRRAAGVPGESLQNGSIDLPLTPRESQVLRQVALGLTNKEISLALGISYETVKEHVQHVLRKVGVADRTQAAVWAVRRGMV